jgi:hypothetical protein
MAHREKLLAYQVSRRAARKEEATVSMMRDLKSAAEVVMEVAGVLEKFAGKEVPLHIVVGDMRLAAEVMRLTGEDLVGRLVRGKIRQQGAAAGTEPMGHKTA